MPKRRCICSDAANTLGQPVTVGAVALLAGGECISVLGIVNDTMIAHLATVAPATYMRKLLAALLCRLLKRSRVLKLDK